VVLKEFITIHIRGYKVNMVKPKSIKYMIVWGKIPISSGLFFT
jgi:hypothetical protein